MDGGARLSSLRRAAEAMDCTLVYAFIPNSTLQQTVERQAGTILEKQMKRQTVFLLPRQQIHSEIVACHLWIRLVDSKEDHLIAFCPRLANNRNSETSNVGVG